MPSASTALSDIAALGSTSPDLLVEALTPLIGSGADRSRIDEKSEVIENDESVDHGRSGLHRLEPHGYAPRRGDQVSSSTTSRRVDATTCRLTTRASARRGDDCGRGRSRTASSTRSRPEVVVHAAASYKDPEAWAEDSLTNAVGTANVVRATEAAGVARLIYLQTALCYGLHPDGTADHACSIRSIPAASSYAISKTAGEYYVRLSKLRLDLVPPRERLRPAQPERAAADLLPAADRRQAVLRHGHAARLRLRRRPGRGRAQGGRRRGPFRASTTCRRARTSRSRICSTRPFSRWVSSSTRTSRFGRATPTTLHRSCSTLRVTEQRLRLEGRDATRDRCRAARSSTTATTASRRRSPT